jgi:DNA-binding transcriptional MerR regulator
MTAQHSLINENNFLWGTGLNPSALRKFEEFGFVNPIITEKQRLYYEHDLELVRTMKKFVDRKLDLRQAYEKALQTMQDQTAKVA